MAQRPRPDTLAEPLILAVVGPESTGKTTLAKSIAETWSIPWVEEAARGYLEGRAGYEEADLLEIARRQWSLEQEAIARARRRGGALVLDTDLLVIRIWAEVRFRRCDPWIIERLEDAPPRLYLLTGTEVPWEPDPLRENPHDRDQLYRLYREALVASKHAFLELEGTTEARIMALERYLAARRER